MHLHLIQTYARIYTITYTYTYACIHTCAYDFIYAYTYLHTYTYTYKGSLVLLLGSIYKCIFYGFFFCELCM